MSKSDLAGSRFFFCQCEAASGISGGLTLHASEGKDCIVKIRLVKFIGGLGHRVEAVIRNRLNRSLSFRSCCDRPQSP